MYLWHSALRQLQVWTLPCDLHDVGSSATLRRHSNSVAQRTMCPGHYPSRSLAAAWNAEGAMWYLADWLRCQPTPDDRAGRVHHPTPSAAASRRLSVWRMCCAVLLLSGVVSDLNPGSWSIP